MAAARQMSMNEQVLKGAVWVKPEAAEEGYCLMKGRGGLVFYYAKPRSTSLLYEVDEKSKLVGGGTKPALLCEIFVFSAKKKY